MFQIIFHEKRFCIASASLQRFHIVLILINCVEFIIIALETFFTAQIYL